MIRVWARCPCRGRVLGLDVHLPVFRDLAQVDHLGSQLGNLVFGPGVEAWRHARWAPSRCLRQKGAVPPGSS